MTGRDKKRPPGRHPTADVTGGLTLDDVLLQPGSDETADVYITADVTGGERPPDGGRKWSALGDPDEAADVNLAVDRPGRTGSFDCPASVKSNEPANKTTVTADVASGGHVRNLGIDVDSN